MTDRILLILALGALTACGEPAPAPQDAPPPPEPILMDDRDADDVARADEMAGEAAMSDGDQALAALEAAVASDIRTAENKQRDAFRNPVETLAFFGVEPDDTVVEIWPGRGWYTEILAPYIAQGGGTYYAAGFDPMSNSQFFQNAITGFQTNFVERPDAFGDIKVSVLSQANQEIAPPASADVVLTFRNVHNFEMGGWTAQAFAAFYEALKPGGTLGIVDHRLPEQADSMAEKTSGYVKMSTVRQYAEDAGFVFDGASEVNANPNDDADHPFGVWTLPPISRLTDQNGESPDGFDAAQYVAIGESDRMTVRFKKPLAPEEALLE
ncbi:MAG: hypothetical protein AAF788_00100 [Pseudomonadota bacterium]